MCRGKEEEEQEWAQRGGRRWRQRAGEGRQWRQRRQQRAPKSVALPTAPDTHAALLARSAEAIQGVLRERPVSRRRGHRAARQL